MGGSADAITLALSTEWREGLTIVQAVRLAVDLLGKHGGEGERHLGPGELEVAVLERSLPRRTFSRISRSRLAELLG